ncbi:MAG: hypothetical protein GY755_06775, partial [Chloroflexi bacterium]|nr:hypothetical protein [Chloroflexota bacterium]
AEYPRYARFIQLAPAEGYSGAFGPFSLLAFGQKRYPRFARVIQLAPVEGYSWAFGPFSLLAPPPPPLWLSGFLSNSFLFMVD